MDLPEHIKLSLLDHPEASEQVLLAGSIIVFGDLIELEEHLQFKELFLDQRLVVQFPVDDLFDLCQDEFQAGQRREEQVIDQEHGTTSRRSQSRPRRARALAECERSYRGARARYT